jgi:hypothetical protein
MTANELDILSRALSVIEESEGADEHGELLADLRSVLVDHSPALVPYRLPDGRIVRCDVTATKYARVIDFTLADGSIVVATMVAHVESK